MFQTDGKQHTRRQVLGIRFRELAQRCDRNGYPCFTDFLPAEDFPLAENIATSERVTAYYFGGYPGARRGIIGFFPEYLPFDSELFALELTELRFRDTAPSHRDFLGAVLGLGLERDTVGDIVIAENRAWIVSVPTAASLIRNELKQVGRVGVKPQRVEIQEVQIPEPKYEELKGTIASMRSDAIAAFVTRLSREKAAMLIRQGKMQICSEEIDSVSLQMQVGDVFSIRGYGKFRITEIGELTRKDRLPIIIQKYL